MKIQKATFNGQAGMQRPLGSFLYTTFWGLFFPHSLIGALSRRQWIRKGKLWLQYSSLMLLGNKEVTCIVMKAIKSPHLLIP